MIVLLMNVCSLEIAKHITKINYSYVVILNALMRRNSKFLADELKYLNNS